MDGAAGDMGKGRINNDNGAKVEAEERFSSLLRLR